MTFVVPVMSCTPVAVVNRLSAAAAQAAHGCSARRAGIRASGPGSGTRAASDAILGASEQLFVDYVDWVRTAHTARNVDASLS